MRIWTGFSLLRIGLVVDSFECGVEPLLCASLNCYWPFFLTFPSGVLILTTDVINLQVTALVSLWLRETLTLDTSCPFG
jgi:hypothetical protein